MEEMETAAGSCGSLRGAIPGREEDIGKVYSSR